MLKVSQTNEVANGAHSRTIIGVYIRCRSAAQLMKKNTTPVEETVI